MSWLALILGGAAVAAAALWYRYEMRVDAARERLLAGVFDEPAEEVSLWRDALDLLQVTAVQSLLSKSPFARMLQRRMYQAGVAWSLPKLVFVAVLASALVAAGAQLVWHRAPFAVGAALAVLTIGWLVLGATARWRIGRLEHQLAGFVSQTIANLRSGGTPLTAIRSAAAHAPAPIAPAMRELVRSLELGMPAVQVWRDWAERWESDACRLLSTGVRIKWETGGEMSGILEYVLDALESRRRMDLRIATRTAQARLSTWVLIALPFVIGLLTYAFNPKLFDEMLADPVGRKALAYTGALMLVGFFWLRRIARLDG